MVSTTQDVPITAAPQIREDHAEAIMRLLEAHSPPDWSEIALLAIRSPTLLHPLLLALADDTSGEATETLRTELARRVEALLRSAGCDLLRAWLLLGQWSPAPEMIIAVERHSVAASILAECARHLAIETHYPYPDEAYLGGLFHAFPPDLTTVAGSLAELPSPGRPIASHLRLLSPALVDCLSIGAITDEQCLTAHPLLRIMHCARLLVRPDWADAASRLAALTGLSIEALASLRADTRYLAGALPDDGPDDSPYPYITEQHTGALTHPGAPTGLTTFRDAALSGLVRLVFDGVEEQSIAGRYKLACRLLSGIAPPFLLVTDDGRIRALPLGIDTATESFIDELELRLEDEASVISLAARSARPSSWAFDSLAVSRSLVDLQIGRRLGPGGFDCIPLRPEADRGVALRHRCTGLKPACGESLLGALCGAALNAWLKDRRQRAASDATARRIELRFREHARKLAHEANNPLTVIRSYLEVMSQRHRDATGLDAEVAVIDAEIDRLTGLVRALGNPPEPGPEPAHCALAGLLNELRALYAPTLFDRRGIQFELRVAHSLPDVAMPASKLKQVIINLFRNASEALQPGGRFSVVAPGQLIANGVPCIEIRVIDNGPGLPQELLANLFAPHSTSKGGDHQGLGLALVREILAESGAYVLCRSQPGTGTSFQILVPTHESS